MANPARFMRLCRALLPWTATATILLFLIGLPLALVYAPADYQQGETVRIMYIHVPAAWMALFAYVAVAGASAALLIWRHPVADLVARAASPAGAAFALLCLATGSLWGKPMWGTWWVWDARLTSMLVLLFLYLGHMALLNAFEDPERGGKSAAVLALVGVINVPIIKFSVDWWNTLHQPASVFRMDGPTIQTDMLWPLLVMALAFKLLFATIVMLRARAELAARKLRLMQIARAVESAQATPAAA